MNEMVCNVRHDLRHRAVRNNRDFLDFRKMRLEELQVSKQRVEVFPAGKRFCADQYSAQRPMSLQICVDVARQHGEICRFERPFGIQHKYPVVLSQYVLEHWISSIRQWREYSARGNHINERPRPTERALARFWLSARLL